MITRGAIALSRVSASTNSGLSQCHVRLNPFFPEFVDESVGIKGGQWLDIDNEDALLAEQAG
jgi:hypothetical protein